MRLPPSPQAWRDLPSWQWVRSGVGESRRRVVLAAARSLQGLERMDQIKYAVLERSGGISIIAREKKD